MKSAYVRRSTIIAVYESTLIIGDDGSTYLTPFMSPDVQCQFSILFVL